MRLPAVRPVVSRPPEPLARSAHLRFILPLCLATLTIAGIGTLAYRGLCDSLRRETYRTLTVIAEQKRQQIEKFLAETVSDAEMYFWGNAQLPLLLGQWLASGRQQAHLLSRMRERIDRYAQTRGWDGIVILDAQGQPVFTVGAPAITPDHPAMRDMLGRPRIETLGLHLSPEGRIAYTLIAPIGEPGKPLLGVGIITWFAERRLFPLVESWPVPTNSAETLLVRAEGNEVQFLSPLRHEAEAALRKRLPIAAEHLPAALAARGHHGIVEQARDYRNVPVLAYITPISGAPWLMIAKMDRDEAEAYLRDTAWITGIIVALSLLLVYMTTYQLWRRDRQRREIEHLQVREAAEARFRIMFRQAPVGVGLFDPASGHIYDTNPRFAEIVGRSLEELRALDWMAVTHPDDTVAIAAKLAQLSSGELSDCQLNRRLLRPDGSVVWVSMTVARLALEIGDTLPYLLCMIDDITERVQRQQEIVRQRELKARQESEQRLGAMVAQSLTGIIETDPTGRFVKVNDHVCALLGYTREDMIGKTARDITYAEDWEGNERLLRQLFEDGQAFLLEKRYCRKDGSLIWVNVSVARLLDDEGQVSGMIALVVDIDARKRQEETLRLAIQAAHIGIWEWNLVTDHFTWSPEQEQLWGYAPGEFTGARKTFTDRIHPDDRARLGACIEQSRRTRAPYVQEFRLVWPDGSLHWTEGRGEFCYDTNGKPLMMRGTSIDITARKQAEQELLEKNRQLGIANAAKTRFLGHMSHELRTPLNGILGFAELLERDAPRPDQRDALGMIRESGKHLLHIINDLLDIAELETGRLSLETQTFRLPPILAHVALILGPRAQQKRLALHIPAAAAPDEEIVGDPGRLEQILLKLVGNAIKFTEQGSVELAIQSIPGDAATLRLRIEVRDTGTGMSLAAQSQLFQAFRQGDASLARRHGGTGLGLVIGKQLVELMGGELGVVSHEGIGSTFWLEIPFRRAHPDTGPATATVATVTTEPTRAPLDGLRVLAVDDNPVNLRMLERVLQLQGASVMKASEGRTALATLRERPRDFDVVLMDVQMPVLDGLAATREIRSNPDWDALPVIALTAGVLPEERAAALAAGMNDFLAKPLDIERMKAVLSPYAGRAAARPADAAVPLPVPG